MHRCPAVSTGQKLDKNYSAGLGGRGLRWRRLESDVGIDQGTQSIELLARPGRLARGGKFHGGEKLGPPGRDRLGLKPPALALQPPLRGQHCGQKQAEEQGGEDE